MRCGVVVFPGASCDHDVYHVLKHVLDQEVTIELGAPIEASSYTLENKEELMEEVRAAIARLCGEDAEETVAEPLTL